MRCHLLPPAPSKFLDALVTAVMELEQGLPGATAAPRHWSQYREALVPYMNRHAPEAVMYFIARLGDPRHFRMLHALVKTAEGKEVREQLATKQADELLAHTFDAAAQRGAAPNLHQAGLLSKASELRFQGVVLVHTLVKRMPHWLPSQPAVLQKLIEVWTSPSPSP